MTIRRALVALLTVAMILFTAGCAVVAPEPEPPAESPKGPPGRLAGTVHFIGTPCAPKEISGKAPQVPPCDGPYPGYEIIIYARDGRRVMATTRSDAEGAYGVDLPPGTYVIYTQRGLRAGDRETHRTEIRSEALTTLNLVIDTGIR